MLNSKILLLIPCCLFGALLIRRERGDPSIRFLKMQITNLQRQLQGYDDLKREYERDEIEIGWANQHLSELRDRKAEISNSLTRGTETLKEYSSGLNASNKQMARYLSALHEYNIQTREKEMQEIHRLEQESISAHRKANHAHAENMVLKEILVEMQSLLDVEKTDVFSADAMGDNSEY